MLGLLKTELTSEFRGSLSQVNQSMQSLHDTLKRHIDEIRKDIVDMRAIMDERDASAQRRIGELEDDIAALKAAAGANKATIEQLQDVTQDLARQLREVNNGSRGPARAAGGFQEEDGRFSPSWAALRGWSPWCDDMSARKGITREIAEKICLDLKRDGKDWWGCVERTSYHGYKVFQIMIHFKSGSDVGKRYELVKALNTLYKQGDCKVAGCTIYVAMEQAPWKRTRNALLAKHARRVEEVVPGARLHLEWSSGELWAPKSAANPDILLGQTCKDGTFKWIPSGLAIIGTSVEALEAAAS
jgi:uncharacterized protein YukE